MPELTPGVPSALSPLVRRIVAPNPGLLTGPGTNTYLVGIDEVAVIDPGPDDADHLDAIVRAAAPYDIRWILLTHTHVDHAPGAAPLRERTGAEVLSFTSGGGGPTPDRELGDGDVVRGSEFALEVLHTPGHAPDHLCYLLDQDHLLFTGDTVLEGTTTVVSPETGGDMAAYLESLRRLRAVPRLHRIAPGHGDVIEEPGAYLDGYLAHRSRRERQILDALAEGTATIDALVATVYAEDDLPDELRVWAARQVHAHLLALRDAGAVEGSDAEHPWSLAA